MATPKFNSKSPTIRRILKEAAEISNSPSPDYTATPLESDLFEWHFTFRGVPNSSYADGIYHGRIILPPTYPLRPPSFRFSTPSGRFEVNREICLSISGHHEETWQPAWGVRTALVALRTFMETDPSGQLGGLETSDAVRRRHATASRNFKCTTCGKTNLEIIQECEEAAKALAESSEAPATGEKVEVPAELKMGWTDQLGQNSEKAPDGNATAQPSSSSSSSKEAAEDTETAELAEGFVSTGNAPAAPIPDSAPVPAAQPAQEVPAPTPTVPMPVAPNTHPAPPVQRPATEAVPVWVDRLIVILVVLLAALIARLLMHE
ncbi:UBC-like protein [Sodiomyces alkalinus F11]|uniref:UBC-like protein n=1 Tax=Sodiomyces alkalinus (strain CBS 110278 / VKM F-3762 / F11) TaxID=1314773 RepID=A0A3N2Q2P1_SODAK|nr:UBC-like protein [Sodiomyces alkalinus F11]ROT40885.1 UBC-like protein [Sodiomyces alkalinus F11]